MTNGDKLLRTAGLTAVGAFFGGPGMLLGFMAGAIPLWKGITEEQDRSKLREMQASVYFDQPLNRMANRFKERETSFTTETHWSREPFHTVADECEYIKRAIPVEIAERNFQEVYGEIKIQYKYPPGYWNMMFLWENDRENFYKEGWDKLMKLKKEDVPKQVNPNGKGFLIIVCLSLMVLILWGLDYAK